MAGRARENMDNWDRLRLLLIVALIATGGIYWGSALLEGHRPQSPQPSPAGLLPATASSTFAKNDQGLAVKLGNPNEGATFIPNANSTRKDITDRLPDDGAVTPVPSSGGVFPDEPAKLPAGRQKKITDRLPQ